MMRPPPVGRVASLHRYPVKSMAGEDLATADVTAAGVSGDRSYALVEDSTQRVVSAKRPNKWAGILDYRASFISPFTAGAPVPPVCITWPDGKAGSSAEPTYLNHELSKAFGAPVTLRSVAPKGATFEYHWPDMDGLVYGGRTYRDEITEHEMPPGTFFDGSPLHVLTTASAAHLQALAPKSQVDVRRFRSNIVIEPVGEHTGFVEDGWVGRTLCIGDDLRVEITRRCLRCVMVSLPHLELKKDPSVLRAVFDHNQGHLGVKGAATRPGRVCLGEAVWLE